MSVVLWSAIQDDSDKTLLLPDSRAIVGTVADAAGNPLADAQLRYAGTHGEDLVTDVRGKFALDTKAPAFLVRKDGFETKLVRTPASGELRITLDRASQPATFSVCVGDEKPEGLHKMGGRLRFPRMNELHASQEIVDVDYATRHYAIGVLPESEAVDIMSGMVGAEPSEYDVWRSSKYKEIRSSVGDIEIMDSRGQFTDGKRWRSLGLMVFINEVATYSGVDDATATVYDRFLDGACFKRKAND